MFKTTFSVCFPRRFYLITRRNWIKLSIFFLGGSEMTFKKLAGFYFLGMALLLIFSSILGGNAWIFPRGLRAALQNDEQTQQQWRGKEQPNRDWQGGWMAARPRGHRKKLRFRLKSRSR